MRLFGIETNVITAAQEVEERRLAREVENKRRDKQAYDTTTRFEQSLIELETILTGHRERTG